MDTEHGEPLEIPHDPTAIEREAVEVKQQIENEIDTEDAST